MSIFLIVDDSPVDRMMFKGLIERISGYTVVEAENGMDALEKVATWNPDTVITDLQMPKMDGLDLVKQLRLDFPRIPVVLATGHGSSLIANQALASGAAGYVPKSKLNDLLIPTLRNIIARKQCEAHFIKLMDCGKELTFRFALNNDRELFPPLIDLCKNTIEGISNLEYIDVLRIGIAIEQALHNAMFRGNLEIPASIAVPFGDELPSDELRQAIRENKETLNVEQRKIDVKIKVMPSEFTCIIRDDGPGFRAPMLGDLDVENSGRGINLMKMFVHEVHFNERGNEVSLKHTFEPRHPEPAQANGATNESVNVMGKLTSLSTGKHVDLRRDKLIVGSSRSCHIALVGNGIADHHCLLVFQNESWNVTKMRGEHHILVNGQAADQTKLSSGDVLQVGDRRLKIEY